MSLTEEKDYVQAKHDEDVEITPQLYTETAEFKERERKVVRKLDIFIAPLMGAFNFIVSLHSQAHGLIVNLDGEVISVPVEYRFRCNTGHEQGPEACRL